jgi:hypothetical protein
MALTDRAGRWVVRQVGDLGRTVNEIAVELGCDWHTVNDAVIAYGEALLEADTERVGAMLTPWAWTRRCSTGPASGGPSSGAPRSSMSAVRAGRRS